MSDDQELRNSVIKAAQEVDGRQVLACAKAFKLAADAGVPPADVGRICNEEKIKIVGCQLGCF
jgi:hypothetical protein